ncbi:copper-binding protein [Yersinia intermedia]|jgi:Cu(I)/Ag(I) efflux system periplasmic protein CusF|uniref:copper-binding protein n=1 Tax=Yersinia intermedia TaxID=631 RepID=UPI0005E5812D|nr:copper-binding protein [Yersinia intermedia]MCB5298221.1 copper-binding protein [Yersinia intermedia]MDA5482294.1 copper-binding protein [Yersinia intermedia]MDA5495554.1 copper-binding protein [Yersinia intermedia]CNI66142.1 putative efflux system protein [Yersinia intermedia]CNJ28372.1 putative efflux system protein [Yersinia intermedia]
MRILFSAVSAVLLLSSPLFAANPAMSESSPMSHGSHAIMADSAPAESYHSQGQIKTWHATRVSIAHSAIPALSWPPMTMTFDLPESLAAQPLPAGTSVTFSFRQTEQGYQLTAISAQQP